MAAPGRIALRVQVTATPSWETVTDVGDSNSNTGPSPGVTYDIDNLYCGRPPFPDAYAVTWTMSPALGLGGSTLITKTSPDAVGVNVGNGVEVGVGVGQGVGVPVGVTVCVGVGITVGIAVGVGAGTEVGVAMGVVTAGNAGEAVLWAQAETSHTPRTRVRCHRKTITTTQIYKLEPTFVYMFTLIGRVCPGKPTMSGAHQSGRETSSRPR